MHLLLLLSCGLDLGGGGVQETAAVALRGDRGACQGQVVLGSSSGLRPSALSSGVRVFWAQGYIDPARSLFV